MVHLGLAGAGGHMHGFSCVFVTELGLMNGFVCDVSRPVWCWFGAAQTGQWYLGFQTSTLDQQTAAPSACLVLPETSCIVLWYAMGGLAASFSLVGEHWL